MSASGDAAGATVFVAVSVEDAFAVFTEEIDLWWRHGRKYRIGGRHPGRLVLTGGPDGRLFESVELPSGPRTFEVGRVTRWEPPHRFEMEWRGVNFAEHETTFVEVAFVPSGRGALVTVRHRGWSAIRDDHPARHGLTGSAFCRDLGLWWGGLLRALGEHVATRGAGAGSAP
ncbi:MAG: SRPBCC domain-containing protein [Sandaracinaceae bacterium]|nr:SRPBCC domain-containing protein [Sandaracinaceae bacterium]